MALKQRQTRVMCPNCGNCQWEQIAEGDKYAFKCEKCEGVFENGQPHLLQEVARYIAKYGGNVCTGFGGLAGEVWHRKWYKKGK